jgi:hypothetical protein
MPACSVAVLCGAPKHAREKKRIGRESVWLSIPRVVRTATPPADTREYKKESWKLSGKRQRKAKELSDFAQPHCPVQYAFLSVNPRMSVRTTI